MRGFGQRLGRPAALVPAAAAAAFLLAGCGGSGSAAPTLPTIPAARTFHLADFQPAGAIQAGKPTTVAFRIDQPSGAPLTNYRRGAGPHTGVHLIIVRDDLGAIVHRHPPIRPDGRLAESVTFPTPGRYRMVVDAYPNTTGPQRNFQLFRWITVAGKHKAQPLPPFAASETVGGYRFTIAGKPHLKALQAGFMDISVKGPGGKPARFTPWFGALGHAIFFRKGTLDYFHTHICAPGASACANTLGGSTVAGTSSTPGKLRVGVLVPTPGTWRLFLQGKVDGKVLTAPFTLKVLPRVRPLRALAWAGATGLVVLAGRTIVYALSPSPLALHFEHAAGGPRLPAVMLAAAALGLGAACLVLWLAALGVRERRLLAPQPVPDPRPLRPLRVLARAAALYVAACTVFTLVESTIHWRAGLGWHGIHCLVGPVHRNALPVLAALALVAAACAEALEHVLAWMRRTIERLRSAGIRLAPAPAPLLAVPVSSLAGAALPVRLRARGPPLA